MATDLSGEYKRTKNTCKRSLMRDIKIFPRKKIKRKKNMGVNDTKISMKMKKNG